MASRALALGAWSARPLGLPAGKAALVTRSLQPLWNPVWVLVPGAAGVGGGGRGHVVGLYGDGGLPAPPLPLRLRPGSCSCSSTRSKEEADARSRDSPPPPGGKALAFRAAQLFLGAMGAQLPGGLVPSAASGRPKAAPSLGSPSVTLENHSTEVAFGRNTTVPA